MNNLIEVGAISYPQCEHLYEQVMDANDILSAMQKLDGLESKIFAPGNTGVLLNTDLVQKINGLKGAEFKAKHGALWISQMDCQASKLLWEALTIEKNIDTKIQFSDRRIWLDLGLNYLQPYIIERWGNSSDVSSRLFINGDLTGGKLIRQVISRLWWHAYLTYDNSSENKWHLLETLCSNSDVLLSITDRPRISHSKIIMMRLLSYLERNENKNLLNRDAIKEFTKWVIAYSGIMELTLMEESDFIELMDTIKIKVETN